MQVCIVLLMLFGSHLLYMSHAKKQWLPSHYPIYREIACSSILFWRKEIAFQGPLAVDRECWVFSLEEVYFSTIDHLHNLDFSNRNLQIHLAWSLGVSHSSSSPNPPD